MALLTSNYSNLYYGSLGTIKYFLAVILKSRGSFLVLWVESDNNLIWYKLIPCPKTVMYYIISKLFKNQFSRCDIDIRMKWHYTQIFMSSLSQKISDITLSLLRKLILWTVNFIITTSQQMLNNLCLGHFIRHQERSERK